MPPTGLTKDSGWEIGVRKTFEISPDKAWDLLTSEAGLSAWLGELPDFAPAKGAEYHLKDGTHGQITVYKPGSHLRLNWMPAEYPRPSIIQVRVIEKEDGKSAIAFHHEQLPNARERGERKAFFEQAIQDLQELIEQDR